jgi:hypothetical protein
MVKVSFSHDIDEKLKNAFDDLADKLPGSKYEVLEAALRLFFAASPNIRLCLLSSEHRKLCLDLVGAIEAPLKQDATAQSGKPAKSG